MKTMSSQPINNRYVATIVARKNESQLGPAIGARVLTLLRPAFEKAGATLIPRPPRGISPEVVDFDVTFESSEPTISLRRALESTLASIDADLALQRETVFSTRKKLVVFDLDSTLIAEEVIDECAREMGVYESVAAVTRDTMKGQIPFAESLHKRVRFLKGLTLEQVDAVLARLRLAPGAEALTKALREHRVQTAIISGGFTFGANAIQKRLGTDVSFANELEFENGQCTGRVLGSVIDAKGKADKLDELRKKHGFQIEETVAVGDGANDLPMMALAGLGIAFNAKAEVRAIAQVHLNQSSLTSILYLLGPFSND